MFDYLYLLVIANGPDTYMRFKSTIYIRYIYICVYTIYIWHIYIWEITKCLQGM